MLFTWVLGLFLVCSVVSGNRTQQEINNDRSNYNPVLCSSFQPLNVEPKQLVGDWIMKQSLYFHRGVIIFENRPDDDFQFCFELCMKFKIQQQNNKLTVNHTMNGKYKNITLEYMYDVLPEEEPGTFTLPTAEFLSEERHLTVISGNPSSHLIIANCKPINLTPGGKPVQVLENLNLITRWKGQRGQSVFTIQELEAQVEMFKLLGLSEAQWSVPYDTTC